MFAFLHRFDQEGKSLDAAVSDYWRAHKNLGAHDRRFIGDAIYGMIRWKELLTRLAGTSSWEKRYQCWQGFSMNTLPDALPLWVRSGGSEWLFNKLASFYGGNRAFDLCRILNEPAPLTVRANLLKTTRDALLSSWAHLGAEPCRQSAAGIRFKNRIALTALPEFKEGLFEIQDEGSQLIADLVGPKPGDQILDYCGGSGGKSLAIASRTEGRGQIYLHDIRLNAIQEARKRFRRAGVQNAQFLLPGHPSLSLLKNSIDWVLADVPCSGSGTYRRNPDMKWKSSDGWLNGLIEVQRKIFFEAASFVRPGGKIVYATCSIFDSENERQVEYFIKTLPLELDGPPLSILPTSGGPDGFFGAIFHRI